MSDDVRRKALRLMELALRLNPDGTKRGSTGDKPTVFVSFSGHNCLLDLELHAQGWAPYPPFDRPDSRLFCLDLTRDGAERRLDVFIAMLEALCAEWGEG